MGALVVEFGKGKKGDAEEEEETSEEEDTDDIEGVMKSAYRDLKKAIKSGDDEAGLAALRDFVQACDYEE